MFDTHESLAVRHTGQLIDEVMSGFIDALDTYLSNPSREVQSTPWYALLRKNISQWEQAELSACYQYILDTHWKDRTIKPSAELMYHFLYGPDADEYDGDNNLKQWCDSDDRHITYADAVAWSETEECQSLVQQYADDESNDWTPLPNPLYNPDPLKDLGGSQDGGHYDEEEFYVPALHKVSGEGYDFTERWHFVAGQIKYLDSVAPDITLPLKVTWLRLALVSQPVTNIFKKKQSYQTGILREQELRKTIPA